MSQMKALVKAAPEPGLVMQQVDMPEPGPDEVLIKVKKTAICGTDVHIWNWDEWSANTVPTPMVVGHEFCGEIVDTGAAVKKFNTGERVSGEGHIVCGTCRNCRAGRGHLCRNTKGVGVNRSGAFAEYLCLPCDNIVPIPDDIPDEIAAIFDPFGNAVHTALSFDLIGEDVLVTISDYRIQLAKDMGVQHVGNAAKEDLNDVMATLCMNEGFDVGLEMSGAAPAMRDMIDKMNNGGKIALLGIAPTEFAVDWNKIIFKMLQVKGIYGREIFETWYKMIAMVQSGLDLSGLITHRINIDQFEQGFEYMISGDGLFTNSHS